MTEERRLAVAMAVATSGLAAASLGTVLAWLAGALSVPEPFARAGVGVVLPGFTLGSGVQLAADARAWSDRARLADPLDDLRGPALFTVLAGVAALGFLAMWTVG